jgi:alpha-tubulin suppressor-like RCC1 family protein
VQTDDGAVLGRRLLMAGGSVKCWGDNRLGPLGDGTYTDSPTPVTVSGISDATQISAGTYHTCALTAGVAESCGLCVLT